MPTTHSCDVAIVGAGLAGGLAALALQARHPALSIRLIDAAPVVGGNHRWSFFADDIAPANRWIVAPLVTHAWADHQVAFPGHARTIAAPYHSIASERLDAVVRAALLPEALMLGRPVAEVTATSVTLADGERIDAAGVIDARGPGDLSTLDLGWQKFVGRELRLSAPHDAPSPTIMDATVPQIDGYRFVYCLPLGPTRMFVEDTYYSDTPDLDRATLADRIHAYAETRGWAVEQAAGEEHGILRSRSAAISMHTGARPAWWRRRGCVPGCSTRPPAIRCPTRSAPPLCWRAPAISPAPPSTPPLAISPRRPGAPAASTGCSTRCCSAPPNRRNATASSNASIASPPA